MWPSIHSLPVGEDSSGLLARVIVSAVMVLIFVGLRPVVRYVVTRQIEDPERRYTVTKSVGYALGVPLVAALTWVWLGDGTGAATYLGILSAGLAIVMQEPLLNVVGFFFLIVKKPFEVGDRIEMSEHVGDVIDIGMWQTTLIEVGKWVDADQSTGRILHIPNSWAIRNTVANYSEGLDYIWDEFDITITYESDVDAAKALLEAAAASHCADVSAHAAEQAKKAAARYVIVYRNLTPIVWTAIAPHGVQLTLRFLVEPRRRRSTASELSSHIIRAVQATDSVEFAYPTTRYFNGPEASTRVETPDV